MTDLWMGFGNAMGWVFDVCNSGKEVICGQFWV